jgi:sulfite exporter TauE/SafE
MDQIIIAFITGFTTGGLSCLAVQGGLLASSLANQIEQDMMGGRGDDKSRRNGTAVTQGRDARAHTALAIALFLMSKIAAYTLLGALLGWIGSFLSLSPTTRAILMIGIGVFMVGNALRMFNVHPIFRFFAFEPPKFITRYIRRKAKNGTDLVTPLFLGALTIFIPCGVTQAMMAVAIGTGSALQGAALMFSFTLGTSPVFFLVAYLATQIGSRLEKYFIRLVAITVLVLGLVSINSGLNLMGSPFSITNLLNRAVPAQASLPTESGETVQTNTELVLNAKNNGYYPEVLRAKADTPISLALVTNNTRSCSRDFLIPALKYYELLPETGQVNLDIPPQPAGTVMRFTCSMGMYTGQIVFEP